MARGMNRVTIIGFVERDPEMRRTASRQPVASFPVSTNRRWTTNSGEDREATEWFNIVAWGDLAEAVVRLVQKDRRIYAEGHLQSRTWQDARGQRHVRTEMVASQMIPMDDRETIANRDPDVENEKMPLCLNRVMVIGNLGRDPEMRYTPEGQALTCFNLATSRTWISANGGRRDSTEWFKVVSWGSLAEICKKHLKKGRRVYIEGELRTRGWQQPDGNKLFRTELVANEMILLGPRPKSRLGDHDGDEFKHEPPL